MKHLFITLLTILSFSVFSQKYNLKISESKIGIANGYNNALVVSLYEVRENDIAKKWKSEMKKLKAKVSAKKEIVAMNAYMKKMGEKPFDVYATVTSKTKGVYQLNVAVDLGGAFLSSSLHADRYKVMESYIYNFAKKMVVSAIEEQLKIAKKEQSKKEKELEKFINNKKTLEDNIKGWEEAIVVAEQDKVQNAKDQEAKKTEIEDAKKVVEHVEKKLSSVK